MVFPLVALFVVWLAVNNRFAAFAALATVPGDELNKPADAAKNDPAKAAKDVLGLPE